MAELTLAGLTLAAGNRPLVTEVGLTLRTGEILAIVGDSGSGKSLTARSLLGILPPGIRRTTGALTITHSGTTHHPFETGFAPVRGLLSYLPQAAARSLDPMWTVGRHLRAVSPPGADILPWLTQAGFPEPEAVEELYPHELSGGMAQRVCIALALAQEARFLIADEPTTGLDAPIQRAFLERLRLLRDAGLGVLLITHDLGLLTGLADRVLRMAGGELTALSEETLDALRQRLTLRPSTAQPAQTEEIAVSLRVPEHRYRRGLFSAGPVVVESAELALYHGEVLGLIGESGSGKSTLARIASGLITPSSGQVTLLDTPLTPRTDLRPLRRRMQLLFQSADAHLNPGMTIGEMLQVSARLHRPGEPAGALASEALAQVGMPGREADRPQILSGGERRRVGIARVLIARPTLLIADEPTTGLDATLRADLLDLLLASANTHLIISHDLHLIAAAAHRIAVMLAGRLIEVFPTSALGQTHHPYTRLLLGETDAAEARAPGRCPLPGLCTHARRESGRIKPARVSIGPGHWIACYHLGEA